MLADDSARSAAQAPPDIPHDFHLIYRKWPVHDRDDMGGWHLVLVASPSGEDGYSAVDPAKETEWLLIDPQRTARFGHAGDTIIPGAGLKWSHLHRYQRGSTPRDTRDHATTKGLQALREDNLDELPWQVIFLSNPRKVWAYRHEEAEHHRTVRMAIAVRITLPTHLLPRLCVSPTYLGCTTICRGQNCHKRLAARSWMGPKAMAGVPMRVIELDSSEWSFYYALPNDRSSSLSFHSVRNNIEDVLRGAFHASRIELAAVRTAQGLQSDGVAEQGSGGSAKPDDEASAHIAEDNGDFYRCAELYKQAAGSSLSLPDLELDTACDRAHGAGETGRGCDDLLPLWRQADLLVAAAHCHRRATRSSNAGMGAADATVESALRLFPRHADALHAKGTTFIPGLLVCPHFTRSSMCQEWFFWMVDSHGQR